MKDGKLGFNGELRGRSEPSWEEGSDTSKNFWIGVQRTLQDFREDPSIASPHPLTRELSKSFSGEFFSQAKSHWKENLSSGFYVQIKSNPFRFRLSMLH